VLDEQGVPRFELLQRFQRDRKGALIYYVFDLFYLNGADLTKRTTGAPSRDLESTRAEGRILESGSSPPKKKDDNSALIAFVDKWRSAVCNAFSNELYEIKGSA
jgi:ATP-dependent DNA ligase